MSSDTDNTSKTVAYWIKISEYDLEVAEAMLEKGHYLYIATQKASWKGTNRVHMTY